MPIYQLLTGVFVCHPRTSQTSNIAIGPVSEQGLLIHVHDLLFIDHFTVSGDMRMANPQL